MEIVRLESDDDRPHFRCGDLDLDEFFQTDSKAGSEQLLSVTYAYNVEGVCCAFFSLSNDSIKLEHLGRSAKKRLIKFIPRRKQYASLPAAKIGRLGIREGQQRSGIGTIVLDYLKAWFTKGNKTGCRFLLVDAYNTVPVVEFYKKNGFQFLTSTDESDDTRIMYFDLFTFRS